MRRLLKALLVLLGCLAGTAGAQEGVARIGVLAFTNTTAGARKALVEGLRELGYSEGRNIRIEWRAAEGRQDRVKALAEELVRLKVDVIVATLTPAVQAAKNATATIPIVMAFTGAPEATGLVASLSRPGGNVTGISASSVELSGKRLEMLKELLPGITRVGLLVNRSDPFAKPFAEENHAAAARIGLQIQVVDVRKPEDLDPAIAGMAQARVGAVIVQGAVAAPSWKAAALALRHRVPAISPQKQFVDAGGLLSYGASLADAHRRAASFVDRILKGAKPAQLPVELPTRFELVINRKTASALGLSIPPSLMLRADQVIE
jgi:putative ABC transport system substrate-binding protein